MAEITRDISSLIPSFSASLLAPINYLSPFSSSFAMKIKMKKSFASIFLLFLISALNLINVNKAGVSSVTGHEVSTINDYHSLNGDTSNIEEIDELNKLSATPNDETQNLLIVDQQKMNRIKIMSKRSSQSASDGDICKDYIHFYCDCDYPDPGTARHVQCSIFNTTGLTSNSSEWNNFWTQPNIESLTIDCRGTSGGLNYLPLVAFNYISNKIKAINLIYFNIGTIYSYSFNNIHTIESIILDDNNITEIEDYSFFNLPNLTKLSLARNNLDVVKDGIFHNLANLKELDISGSRLNKIEDKSLNNLQSLTILTLKNNNISTLSQFTFKNLVKLEDLDLAYNSLTLIVNDMFADCANLKYIDLQSNQIEQIEGNAFRGLKLLVTLNLSRNKLKYVPSDVTLIQSNVISYVSLAENQIEKLDPNFIDSIHNKDQLHFLFDFKGNNWRCDCSLKWMEKLAKVATNTELIEQLNNSNCWTPSIDTNADPVNILKTYLPSSSDECWRKHNPRFDRTSTKLNDNNFDGQQIKSAAQKIYSFNLDPLFVTIVFVAQLTFFI